MISGDAARLAEIDRALAELLDAEPSARPGLLAEIEGRDAELAREVAELLDHAEDPEGRAAGWLAGPLWREIDAGLAESAVAAGDRLGAWRIRSEIGRGGMAVVYLAERADGAFTQRAAIKLLQAGGGSRDAIRRFEQERQILASLQHPAIARLLDGGVDARGRPFLVLEHVLGEPIDAFCDRHRLPIDRRLDLFAQVARAVDFAHRNLIIHRDLKPSNILVEGDGAVKLLDFGIAKLLAGEPVVDPTLPLTRTVLRAMTPEYASPEQVRGEPVTTTSDVYQLGLLLYELLTGERAYRVPAGSAAAIEEAICTTVPRRPSLAVRQGAMGKAPGPAALRSQSAAALSGRLAGDLDTILLTALAKEPERRYGSVKELLDDLDRHREGLPVRARRPTWGYRVGKLVRRHRWGVAAAAALVLLLVGYAVTVTLQAAEIARERDRARAEAAKAQEIQGFLVELFNGTDPELARGREVTVREVLDQAGRRIDSSLRHQPEVQAELLSTVGEIYRKLGLYSAAEPLLVAAVARARLPGGPEGSVLAGALVRLARLRRQQGDAPTAEHLLLDALALERKLPGDRHLETTIVWNELALVLQEKGRLADANRLLLLSLATRRKLLGDERPEVAEGLSLLAANLGRQGRLQEAETLHRRALALRRRLLQPDDPDLATALHNLAITLVGLGRPAEAETLLREALAIHEKVFGSDHPRLASTAAELAQVLWYRRDFAAAETLLRRALAVYRARLGERNPAVARVLATLGRVQQDHGKPVAAEKDYRLALASYPPADPARADIQFNLGTLLEARGDDRAAERLYRQALAVNRRQLGNEHPRVGVVLLQLGQLRARHGNGAGAEPLLRQALAIFRNRLPADHPQTAEALLHLGRYLLGGHRAAEAEPLLKESLALRRARYGEADPRTEEARHALRRCQAARGRHPW